MAYASHMHVAAHATKAQQPVAASPAAEAAARLTRNRGAGLFLLATYYLLAPYYLLLTNLLIISY